MQYGFVIDHSRCIGCHACTVACKAENDVPIGSFRTWVKYTEQGAFPEVKRSFAVLRCNQCTDAPCIEICPVVALDKRPDGIVDIDPKRCIGCKGCMQACPYDALYINEDHGVAEKCHFCAHRVERGLAPACAVVCPTEAIIPGDFHNPDSRVSKMLDGGGLTARKVEAGTGPNVWYRDVAPAGVRPLDSNHAGGYLWSDRPPGVDIETQEFEALKKKAEARAVYDVGHKPMWGRGLTAYLFFKSIAAGLMLAILPWLPPFSLNGGLGPQALLGVSLVALLALGLTTAILVLDLKKPARFLYLLIYPNWNSWLAKGAWVLMGYSTVLMVWLALGYLERVPTGPVWGLLTALTAILGILTAIYTAWLFRQARGRVLWLAGNFPWILAVHAIAAGAAVLLLGSPFMGDGAAIQWVRGLSVAAIVLEWLLNKKPGVPKGREEEFARVLDVRDNGPFARELRGAMWLRWAAVVAIVGATLAGVPIWGLDVTAGLLLLVALWVEQDVTIRAGQALPIS